MDWDALPHVVGCCAPSLRTEFELIGWLGDHLCFSPRRKESWGGLVAEGHQACLLYPATESRMERRMAWLGRWWWGPRWQVRGWTGSSKIRPDIFPSQGLSEMSALDSCHQSVRAFLDTGGLSQRNEVFSMIWFLFFSLADWEQFTFYINHLSQGRC